jgi:hypothetical protein
MKKKMRPLVLSRETVRNLDGKDLKEILGGDDITCASCRRTCVEDGCDTVFGVEV